MDAPIVEINEGKIRGFISDNYDNDKIYCFLGIPYAKPPVGELRFKPAVPAEPWEGVRDATKNGDSSYQKIMGPNQGYTGSEDCLNLNVFTKEVSKNYKTLKPVMVWIHGGGFQGGSNGYNKTGPEYLLTEDIVLVVINYRLSILGFMRLSDTAQEVPGNLGLKDQQFALKWVQKNIENFGGDPNNVTLFGQSAGGLSIHCHLVAQSSKGLFHKGIMQSGPIFVPDEMLGRFSAVELIKSFGKDVKTEGEALDILKSLEIPELFDHLKKYSEGLEKVTNTPLFGPVVEKPNDTAMFTENPITIIESGNYNQVPIIIGYNSNENLFMGMPRPGDAPQPPKGDLLSQDPQIRRIIPYFIRKSLDEKTIENLCQKLAKMYNLEDPTEKALMRSDSAFNTGIIGAAKAQAQNSKSPVYLYRISIDDELNGSRRMKSKAKGTAHGDELPYLFSGETRPKPAKGSTAELAMRRLVKLWTNFAKYGNPTPGEKDLNVVWKPVEKSKTNFLDIGAELVLGVDPEAERMQFWKKEIYKLNKLSENLL